MFQPFWPLGLLRCLRVLLLRNAEINSSQVAELLAGTLHLEPTEEVRCVCCAKVDAVGCLRLDGCQMLSDDEWFWMMEVSQNMMIFLMVMIFMDVLKMVNDGEWLMMVKWWRVQVVVPLLLRINDDGEWWLMVNYDLPGYGRVDANGRIIVYLQSIS